MKSYIIKDLMVPLSEYATISGDATLYESMLSLLVTDGKKTVGILRQTDVFTTVFNKMRACFIT